MRQNIQVDPSKKLFESYIDFSGGLNSEIANENLRDNEYPVLDNVDLSNRGSAKKRTGRKLVNNLSEYGIGQGLFHFFREGEPKPDTIIAVGGKIFIILHGQTTAVQLNMTDAGAPFTFQTTKQIEAVQYGTKMYVATGTKIVVIEYENPGGFTGKVIEPYKPTVMEAIYIGTNALAPNPDTFIQDGVDTTLKIAGIKPTKRTGIVNTTTPMTVFINKPVSMTSLDYKWEFKKSEAAADARHFPSSDDGDGDSA